MTPLNFDRNSDDDYEYYRGMKFRFTADGRIYWRTPMEHGIVIEVISGLEKIVKKLLKERPAGGSFRITEAREVLLKIVRGTESPEIPKFIGMAEDEIKFKSVNGGIEHNPSNLNPGDLWTGIYDGTRLSFMRGIPSPKIWWSTVEDFNVRYAIDQRSTPVPDDLLRDLYYWKPLGGRFYVTIDGHIITLIDPKQRDERHKEQFERMTNEQQQLVEVKEKTTKMFAIYIGKWNIEEMFSFKRPRRFGDPIDQKRKEYLSKLLGGDHDGDQIVSPSVVPINAEFELPPFGDIPDDKDSLVLEMVEQEINEEEE